jgi:hypothetical protein
MIADLDRATRSHGNHCGYRYAPKLGAIGQGLVSAAEALGLRQPGSARSSTTRYTNT